MTSVPTATRRFRSRAPRVAPARGQQRLDRFSTGLLAPALGLLAVLSLFPFVYLIWMSFNKVTLIGGVTFEWTAVENWTRMFTDGEVLRSWLLSFVYFGSTLGLELLLGITFALVLYELVRARSVVLSLVLIPMFMAPVIVGLLGRFLTNSTYGLYAWLLDTLGLYGGDILGSRGSALVAVILMDVWQWTPLIALIVLAGLMSVSQAVLDASNVDGATYWQRLRHIILPSIAGVLLIAVLIRAMDAIRYFDIITVTTNGGPADATKIIPVRLYETAFRFFDLGYAAVLGFGMLVFTIIVANVFVGILQRRGLTR